MLSCVSSQVSKIVQSHSDQHSIGKCGYSEQHIIADNDIPEQLNRSVHCLILSTTAKLSTERATARLFESSFREAFGLTQDELQHLKTMSSRASLHKEGACISTIECRRKETVLSLEIATTRTSGRSNRPIELSNWGFLPLYRKATFKLQETLFKAISFLKP